MSHTVVVEYVDFPAEVDAVCERCSEIADEISKKLSLLKNNAAETGSRMAQDYIRQLEQQAEEITEKYREFTSRIGAMDRSEKIRLREAGSIRAQVADLKGRLNSVLYNGIDSAGALIREQIFAEAEKNQRIGACGAAFFLFDFHTAHIAVVAFIRVPVFKGLVNTRVLYLVLGYGLIILFIVILYDIAGKCISC